MSVKFLNGIDLANQRITSMADPTSATDGVTKQYVDGVARGLTWKQAVVVASTTNIATLSAPGSTMDGVTLTDQMRVLLKNQTTASQNGIYVYTAGTTTLAYALDWAIGVDESGAVVSVDKGTVNAGFVFNVTTSPAVVGTNSVTWSQLGGAGTTYTAGSGLTLTAGAFSVNVATGIVITGGNVTLAATVAGSGLTFTAGVLSVNVANGITISGGNLQLAAGVSGAGLTLTSGVLDVVGGLGITVAADSLSISSAVPVVELFSIGDGSTTAITITFATIVTRDATIQVFRNATPWDQVFPDVTRPSTTTATLTFATAPTSNQFRVVATGR